MIDSIDISSTRYDVDETTKKYVFKKIGRLDRYLPRHARKTASADVRLRQINANYGNKYEAEVIFTIPDKRIVVKDSTVNMLAAIDIIEAKLVTQLRKYKEASIPHVGRRSILSKFKRSYAREAQ
jgi:putative sigma-54 modulation protein